MFPSIAEYTSALRHAESGTFRNLRLALSLDDEGEPIYSRGSYSVVFKAHSEGNEREEWAVKCYVAEQERRIPSCRAIAQQLNSITSPYLLPMRRGVADWPYVLSFGTTSLGGGEKPRS